MKTTILFIVLFLASTSLAQKDELIIYKLETGIPIKDCEITANSTINYEPIGYIESIYGSLITLRIAKNMEYKVWVNNFKLFIIEPITTLELLSTQEHLSNLSEDVVYRIQIGAFSKSIPENYYIKFSNVFAEKINGTHLTRVMIGNYPTMEKVKSAISELKNKGFTDAFIVAYTENVRITNAEAMKRSVTTEDCKKELCTSVNPPNATLNTFISAEE